MSIVVVVLGDHLEYCQLCKMFKVFHSHQFVQIPDVWLEHWWSILWDSNLLTWFLNSGPSSPQIERGNPLTTGYLCFRHLPCAPLSYVTHVCNIHNICTYMKQHTHIPCSPSCCGSPVFVTVTHVFCRWGENQSWSQVALQHLPPSTHIFPTHPTSKNVSSKVKVPRKTWPKVYGQHPIIPLCDCWASHSKIMVINMLLFYFSEKDSH